MCNQINRISEDKKTQPESSSYEACRVSHWNDGHLGWDLASFSTGKVSSRVGVFLFPLNTTDRFFFSHTI